MAKKVVATLQTGKTKNFVKCIKMVKSDEKDSYFFEEEMVNVEHIKDFFNN
jgi:hypothetical protein